MSKRIKPSDYKVLAFLWKNKRNLKKDELFGFPDFGGLPKHKSENLNPEFILEIQQHWKELFEDVWFKDWMVRFK